MENCKIQQSYLDKGEQEGRLILKPPMPGTTSAMLESIAGRICGSCDQRLTCDPHFVGDDIQRNYYLEVNNSEV